MVDYFQSFLHMDEEPIAPSTQRNREFLNIVHFLQFLIRRDYKPSELYSAYTDFVRLGAYIQPLEVRETLDDRLFPSLTQERREKRMHVEMTPNGLNGNEKRVEIGNYRLEGGKEMGNQRNESENEIIDIVDDSETESESESETETERERDAENVNNNEQRTIESTSNPQNHIDNEKLENGIENNQEIVNPTSSNIDLNSDSNPLISHSSPPSKKEFSFSPHSVLDSLLYQPIETVSPTHSDTYRINSLLSFLCREGDFLPISSIVLNRFLFST